MKNILILLFLIVGCNHAAPTTENDAAAESQGEQPAAVTPEPKTPKNQLASKALLLMVGAQNFNKPEDGTTALLMSSAVVPSSGLLKFCAPTIKSKALDASWFFGVLGSGVTAAGCSPCDSAAASFSVVGAAWLQPTMRNNSINIFFMWIPY